MKKGKFQQTISVLALLAVFFASSVLIKAYPGDVDESYGTTGFYIDNLPNSQNQESTVFLDGEVTADGKLTSVGVFSYPVPSFGFAQDFYIQRILPNGSRDPSFGNGTGSVRLANVLPIASQAVARAVRIQQDNKIVVAGVCNIVAGFGTPDTRQSGYGMCAARLLPSGALDTSFGGNNFIVKHGENNPATWFNFTMPAGTTFIHYPFQVESGYSGAFGTVNAAAYDVAIHSDGRIVLAGNSVAREFDGQGGFLGYNHFAVVVTLTPNGALSSRDIVPPIQGFETARRTNGRAVTKVETQSDGSVVAVGFETFVDPKTLSPTAHRWLVYNGSINGTVTWTSENLPRNSHATSIKFTRGNKILVGGFQIQDDVTLPVLMRFNQNNLIPDAAFGTNGKITYCRSGCDDRYVITFSGSAPLRLESIQNDGKILALAGIWEPHRFPLGALGGDRLIRFNPDGSVDRSFGFESGGDPFYFYSYQGYTWLRRSTAQGVAQKIEAAGFAVLQADGKILSGGAYIPAGGQPERAGVTRRQNTFRSGIYSDFGNDGRADLAIYRPTDGVWHDLNSFSGSHSQIHWGISTDKIVPADYDGDGRTDRAVFRDGIWYILKSSDNQARIIQWGIAGDLPRPGDFNGDGEADIAVFRPSDGNWYVFYSNPIQPGNVTSSIIHFGLQGDVPMISDYDGDGKTDYAVFRPSEGVWYILRSSDAQFQSYAFGSNGDIPLNGDFNGDSRSDLAVFRPSNRTWYITQANGGPVKTYDAIQFGLSTDIPAAGDYDNDGKTDIAVYRNGTWWILRSSDAQASVANFGLSSDKPIQAAYLP